MTERPRRGRADGGRVVRHHPPPLTVRPVTAEEAQATLLELGWQLPADAELGALQAGLAPCPPRLVRRRRAPASAPGSCSRGASRALGRSYAYLPEGPALPWEAVARRPEGVARPARRLGEGGRRVRAATRLPGRVAGLGPEPVKKQVGEGGLHVSFTTLPSAVDNPVARSMEAWLDANQWLSIGWRRGRRRASPAALRRRPARPAVPELLGR